MIEYYQSALSRAWLATWDWTAGQGILLTWALAVCALICAVVFTVVRAHRKHHSWSDAMKDVRTAVGNFVLSAIATTVVFLLILFAVFFVRDAPEQARLAKTTIAQVGHDSSTTIEGLKAEIANLKSQIDIRNAKGLFAECHLSPLPSSMPVSGRLYLVFVWGDGSPNQIISMAESFGPPGNPTAWPVHTTVLNFAQCIVTNYSDDVLIDVNLQPKIAFSKMVKRPDGGMEGRGIDHIVDSHVRIPKLDIGVDKPFVFYFLNQAAAFITVEMPSTTDALRLGNRERMIVPVASIPMLHLSPINEDAP
jgi:hypothetical protein